MRKQILCELPCHCQALIVTTNHTTAAWNQSIQLFLSKASRYETHTCMGRDLSQDPKRLLGRLPMSRRLRKSSVLWDSRLATKCSGRSTASMNGPRMDMMRRLSRTNSWDASGNPRKICEATPHIICAAQTPAETSHRAPPNGPRHPASRTQKMSYEAFEEKIRW